MISIGFLYDDDDGLVVLVVMMMMLSWGPRALMPSSPKALMP